MTTGVLPNGPGQAQPRFFLLTKQKRKKWIESSSVVSDSLWLSSPWDSLRQNTGVGSLSLLQGIFPTQGSNPGLPHCGWILHQLSHKGSPRILERVANKSPSSHSYGFSSSHVWIWELDCKESWVLKNWQFWTVVLEKAFESPSLGLQGDPTSPS